MRGGRHARHKALKAIDLAGDFFGQFRGGDVRQPSQGRFPRDRAKPAIGVEIRFRELDHAIAIVPAEWRIVANLGEHGFGSRKSEAALIKGKTRIVASASYAAVAVTEAALRAWLFEITGEPAP